MMPLIILKLLGGVDGFPPIGKEVIEFCVSISLLKLDRSAS